MSKSIQFPRHIVQQRSANGKFFVEVSAQELGEIGIEKGDTIWSVREGGKKKRVVSVEGLGEQYTDDNGEERVRIYGPMTFEKVEVAA